MELDGLGWKWGIRDPYMAKRAGSRHDFVETKPGAKVCKCKASTNHISFRWFLFPFPFPFPLLSPCWIERRRMTLASRVPPDRAWPTTSSWRVSLYWRFEGNRRGLHFVLLRASGSAPAACPRRELHKDTVNLILRSLAASLKKV